MRPFPLLIAVTLFGTALTFSSNVLAQTYTLLEARGDAAIYISSPTNPNPIYNPFFLQSHTSILAPPAQGLGFASDAAFIFHVYDNPSDPQNSIAPWAMFSMEFSGVDCGDFQYNWFVDAGYGSWVNGNFLPNVTPTPQFLSQHGLPDFSGFAYATVMFELQVDATHCTVCLPSGNWEEFVNGNWVPLPQNCLTGGIYHVRPEGEKIGIQIDFSWSSIPEPSGFLSIVGLCILATCRRSRPR